MGAKLSGGGGKHGSASVNSEPNVIPFIDIMLVLLIIFMVAAPKPTVDIKVDLPPPGPAIMRESPDKPTFVSLEDDAGRIFYYVEGEETELSELSDLLYKTVQAKSPALYASRGPQGLFEEGKVFVDADQETDYVNVIGLMSEIDQAGFKKVSLVAEEAQF
jgi:biopolymer transport protein ExbD